MLSVVQFNSQAAARPLRRW